MSILSLKGRGRWRAAEISPQKTPESSCFHLGHMATIAAPYL
jgi:hypothetical protein